MAAYIGSVLVDVCVSHCSGVDPRSCFNINFNIVFRKSLVHSLLNEKL